MTVVLVDPRRPSLVPVEAITLLTGEVQYTEEMPVRVPWSLPVGRPVHTGDEAPVLLSSDPDHPVVKARLSAGDRLIAAPDPALGERLIDVVALMDQLRTNGPWESEQTHDSLRRYLLEETYELFDAVRSGSADDLREELGDVLLQVLFHARIAEDAPQHPFTIDDVADSLLRKLANRVPGVLAGEPISLEEQLAQWDDRKAAEKPRGSCLDGVPTGQPALALAQKVIGRVTDAGVPADLIPESLTSVTVTADVDAESALRADVLEFMDAIRLTERGIAAGRRGAEVPEELDVAALDSITESEWRKYLPIAAGARFEEAGRARFEEVGSTRPSPADVPEPAPAEVADPAPVEVPEDPEAAEAAEANGQPGRAPVLTEDFPAGQLPVIDEATLAAARPGQTGTEANPETSPNIEAPHRPDTGEPQ